MDRFIAHDSRSSAQRAMNRCRELSEAPYSDIPDGLFRPFLGSAHTVTSERVMAWMQEAGLSVRRDAIGTLIGRYEGAQPDAPALLIGSHIDSVRNGGAFDGMLGVVLAIECVSALRSNNQRLPCAIEVAAFGDEEGSRFPQSMLGSRTLSGKSVGSVAGIQDQDGVTLQYALKGVGLDIACLERAHRSPHEFLGYLELHIEQGPILDREGLSVAAVEAIVGIRRFHVILKGEAGHAGTVPMEMRRDALAAASEIVLGIEAYANQSEGRLRATVGKSEAFPGAINIIPGRVAFTVELRSADRSGLDLSVLDVTSLIETICARRNISATIFDRQDFEPALCDTRLTARLEDCIETAGHPRKRLVSGAGHDAMMMCDWIPTTMLFIRSPGGISHHPAETVELKDVAAAFDVMMTFVTSLDAWRGRPEGEMQ
ncbi:allantoate amidohydrolase [Acetobacter nitrogenifigens]|nr:allantoate amidohydrolase [Acetobacter nitrogenifigens]